MHYLIRHPQICMNAGTDIPKSDEARIKILVLPCWHSRGKDISSDDLEYLFLQDPGRHTRGCVRVSFCGTAGTCHFWSRITPICTIFGGDVYYGKRREACLYDPNTSIGGAIATDWKSKAQLYGNSFTDFQKSVWTGIAWDSSLLASP